MFKFETVITTLVALVIVLFCGLFIATSHAMAQDTPPAGMFISGDVGGNVALITAGASINFSLHRFGTSPWELAAGGTVMATEANNSSLTATALKLSMCHGRGAPGAFCLSPALDNHRNFMLLISQPF